jgi:hypothetical protein
VAVLTDFSGQLGARTVTSSDSALLTATADGTAPLANHQIVINNLAATSSFYSNTFDALTVLGLFDSFRAAIITSMASGWIIIARAARDSKSVTGVFGIQANSAPIFATATIYYVNDRFHSGSPGNADHDHSDQHSFREFQRDDDELQIVKLMFGLISTPQRTRSTRWFTAAGAGCGYGCGGYELQTLLAASLNMCR